MKHPDCPMSLYHLAQLNIAKIKYSLDSPQMKDFVDNLDKINQLAEQSPGFIWRFETDEGNATSASFGNGYDDYIINMSVWRDIKSLKQYVFKSEHSRFIMRRKEWFQKSMEASTVLWWVSAAHTPDLEEARAKLECLRAKGPTAGAFSFKTPFPAPIQDGS